MSTSAKTPYTLACEAAVPAIQAQSRFHATKHLAPLTATEQEFQALKTALGATKHKYIVFLRHGQGPHNVAEAKFGTVEWEASHALTDKYLDIGLTEVGQRQAEEVRDQMEPLLARENNTSSVPSFPYPDVIISSPLNRCILTADTAWPRSGSTQNVKRVVVETFRERNGRHTCDKRRSLVELHERAPHWDLDRWYRREDVKSASAPLADLPENEDPSWTEERETIDALNLRALSFLEWVWEQPEQVVYLSGHSGIIAACYSVLSNFRKLNNCEVSLAVMQEK